MYLFSLLSEEHKFCD